MRTFIFFFIALSLSSPLLSHGAAEQERLPAHQKIDQLVSKNLKHHGVKPNAPASDEIFLRRIYMDVIGRAPTKAEAVSFLENPAKNKRAILIKELLNSEGYISHGFNYFADLLRAKTQISGAGNSQTAGYSYERWIKDSLRENKPYDEMVYELLTASGKTWKNGAVGYYLRDYGMPLDNLAITTQVFLGSQIVCAQCHNHPFDSWTQMDYYHLSAFTFGMMTTNQSENSRSAQVLYNQREKPDSDERRAFGRAMSEVLKPLRFNNVWEMDRKLRLPHDYQYDDAAPRAVVKPAVPFGKQPEIKKGEVPIHEFAEWMTSPENARFTKVIANRLWKRAMGLGLIEPVDDMREDTTASNPELMAFLERRMIALDYDMKRFLQTIYLSDTYQRESSTAEVALGQTYHFPGPVLRRLSAEQIWDSLIAMVVDEVDVPNPRANLAKERLITRTEWVANGVYDLSSEEMMEIGLEVAAKQRELAERIQSTQQRVAEAREEEDAEKIRAALNDAALVRGELAETISNSVYRKGIEQKAELVMNDSVSSDDFLAELASVMTEDGLMEPEMAGNSRSNGFDGGQYINGLVEAVLAPQIEALEKAEELQRQQEMKEWDIQTPRQKAIYKSFTKSRRAFVRASDIRSPAPFGHFLREFGQSDRELVENANDQASITQALALMNGTISNGIMSTFSRMSRDLRSDANPLERLDTIYLTMLSRKPTADERKMLLPILREEGVHGTQQVIWTLLNTRQFLFLQ